MKNKQDYLDGKVSHREYWAQFTDEDVKSDLLAHISIKELKASKDKHFNDIPMKQWDAISNVRFQIIGGEEKLVSKPRVRQELVEKLREVGEGVSPAGMVCIYKEMAVIGYTYLDQRGKTIEELFVEKVRVMLFDAQRKDFNKESYIKMSDLNNVLNKIILTSIYD